MGAFTFALLILCPLPYSCCRRALICQDLQGFPGLARQRLPKAIRPGPTRYNCSVYHLGLLTRPLAPLPSPTRSDEAFLRPACKTLPRCRPRRFGALRRRRPSRGLVMFRCEPGRVCCVRCAADVELRLPGGRGLVRFCSPRYFPGPSSIGTTAHEGT